MAERSEERFWCAELHRLRGAFLAAMGADETQIEASFCEAIIIAKKQKSILLVTRAKASYAEYWCHRPAIMPTTTSPLTPTTHGLRVAASFNPHFDRLLRTSFLHELLYGS
jgi:hypothetical protein